MFNGDTVTESRTRSHDTRRSGTPVHMTPGTRGPSPINPTGVVRDQTVDNDTVVVPNPFSLRSCHPRRLSDLHVGYTNKTSLWEGRRRP